MYLTTINNLKPNKKESNYLKSQFKVATELHDDMMIDLFRSIHSYEQKLMDGLTKHFTMAYRNPLSKSPMKYIISDVTKKFQTYFHNVKQEPSCKPPNLNVYELNTLISKNFRFDTNSDKQLTPEALTYVENLKDNAFIKPPLCLKPNKKSAQLVFNKSYFTIFKQTIYFSNEADVFHNPLPFKVPLPFHLTFRDIHQIRISLELNQFKVYFLYNINLEHKSSEVDNNNFLAIDIGLKNFCTMVNNVNNQAIIIDGKPIKAYYHNFNYKVRNYKKKLKRLHQDTSTKKLANLYNKRKAFTTNYLHQVSSYIIKYCKKNNIKKIIFGYNKGMKEQLYKTTSKKGIFFQIPYSKLVNYLSYKCKLNHIEFIIQEESYTSKCDSLALEPLNFKKDYKGERVTRGLYKSSTGKLINADVNAAINIARKAIGKSLDPWVKELASSGVMSMPLRISV
ncbi:Transposase family protein [Haloplasma contractile SSD-17B]|uniref:Transposase family protein n=1 Tax=Haloplasma contractile SSD-17B TaxID=1033810 RepID=U2EBY0_9MOLU|nr:Transposase family protein [Haloplasma contractile SSD-17B]